jgi:hypothetical protein
MKRSSCLSGFPSFSSQPAFRSERKFVCKGTTAFFAAVCALAIFSAPFSTCFAQATAFTYQGRLLSAGTAVSGSAEFVPTLWDAATNGTQVAAHSPSILLVTVSNGVFVLPLDFGAAPFNAGADRWLELQVRTGLGPYTLLTPRQKLTATPYALRSANAGTASFASVANSANSVAASNVSGTLSLAQLPVGTLTNGSTGVNLSGNFSGNGGALSNLSVNSLVATQTAVSITGWGYNEYGERTPPSGLTDVIAVSVGIIHSVALRSNGTLVAWGNNDSGQINVPASLSNVGAVAAGGLHNLALKKDGTVVAWGANDNGQTNVPAGLSNVMAISGGYFHSVALRSNGTVVAWGANDNGETNVPAGLNNVVAISAASTFNLALKADGTITTWGTNTTSGPTAPPPGLNNVVAIAAGYGHSLALKADGTVVAWGLSDSGQTNVPAGLSNVIGIAAGLYHSLALKTDGTVVLWGGIGSPYGETNVPPGLNNVVALCSGGITVHVLVLRKQYQTPMAWLDSDNRFTGTIEVNGAVVNGDVRASGQVLAASGLALHDSDILFRNESFTGGGLGWYGTNKPFGDIAPDGPVLFGYSGGVLGTTSNGYKATLWWNAAQQVGVGTTNPHARLSLGDGFAQSKLLLYDTATDRVGLGVQANQFRLHLATNTARFSFLGAPSSNELVTIQGSGLVGVGITNPATKLHVAGTDAVQLRLQNTVNSTYWNIYSENNGNSGNLLFVAGPTGGSAWFRKADGFYFNSSDARLKRDINPLGSVLHRVLQLRPVTYRLRDEADGAPSTYGFLAQEVEPLFPEVVGEYAGKKALSYSELVPVAIGAIQELNAKFERSSKAKDAEIQKLKAHNATLEKRLQRLERLMDTADTRE